jgi:hypothetical protein
MVLLKVIANQRQLSIMLALITVTIYAQSIPFDFLNFDDNFYILLNPYIQEGISWSSIKWAWSPFGNDFDPYYMPLTWTSFLLDGQIFGINAAGFHLTNLLLHVANVLLVFYIVNNMTGRLWGSAIVAFLFAIHPQHVEAVVWIAERKEVLSAFFGLLALACYSQYVCQPVNRLRQHRFHDRHYLLTFLFFFLSVLTKPTMVTLPFLLLLLDWWPLNRLNKKSLPGLIIEKVPFLLLSAFLVIIILSSVGIDENHAIIASENLPLSQRISNVFIIYIGYLENTFLPLNMPGWYPYPLDALPNWKIYGAAGILIGITLIASLLSRKQPYLLMGWLWFIGLIFPAASVGVYAHGDVLLGDRWTYLPHIGLFISITWYLSFAVTKWPKLKSSATYLMVIIFILLSITSWQQMKKWSDSESYWLHILEADNNSHFPNFMLGTHYRDLDKIDAAIEYFIKAQNNLPTEGYYNLALGNAYLRKGMVEEAWAYFDKVLASPTAEYLTLRRIGIQNLIYERYNQANSFFYKMLEHKDLVTSNDKNYYIDTHFFIGVSLSMSGDEKKALKHFKEFLDYTHNNSEFQCKKSLIIMSDLIDLGVRRENLNTSFQLLTQLCK